ncbi:synaptic vesicle membrane protein VAT-1 homolog [Nematostella vectensis]|uniref:synaptic vesicle membrane protein VAT-1 homolog n=1 Tax=Nematostella vectensis TaxID=45351 RepID=UPI00207748C2|nr:synaptic vesicle membrane protein VAT-1 homolog [Nematostella vectensis]
MISIASPGGYDKLEYRPLPNEGFTEGANVKLRNIPEQDLVVVKTFACGVNYADICIRWGLYESAKKFVGWPITPGFEFSGVIQWKGENVTEFKIGQEVFGASLFGSYSECIRVPKNQLFALPKKMSKNEAAGLPTVALTAWYAFFELAHTRPGAWVLVHSAAGGVGSMLVQMAKIAGCHAVGVVGAGHKIDFVRSLGCDHVIDKSAQDLWQEAKVICPDGFSAVFDANGVATLKQSYAHLAPGGKLVIYGFHTMLPRSSDGSSGSLNVFSWLKMAWNYIWTPGFNPLEMTTANKSIMAFNLSFMFDQIELLAGAMKQIIGWVEEGQLKVARVSSYPLKQVAMAHRDLESAQTVGKLVLTMNDH